MSNLSNRQMNVPGATRHEEEIQTDVNLMGGRIGYEAVGNLPSAVFEFATGNRLSSFSDYYLLGQLKDIVASLQQSTASWDEHKSKLLLSELSGQIHGLLAKELRLTGHNSDYYKLLNEKEKEIIRLQVRYGHLDSKVNTYETRIAELERQIQNLRSSLKIYQGAEEENQLYKEFFREAQQIVSQNKRPQDLQNLLKNQINPKIKELEVNLADLSKSGSRDRNKAKGAISRYALELDKLMKDSSLDWQKLSQSSAGFFTSIQHLNSDDWVQERINIARRYEELMNRHTAILSIVRKNIDELVQKDKSFKSLAEVRELEEKLRKESQAGMETVIVNGWIGLGVVHCHRHGHSDAELHRTQQMALSFQSEMRKLIAKFPQLEAEMNASMRDFLSLELAGEVIEGGSMGWLKDVVVRQSEVVTVENTYNYYSKSDKQLIFHLRVLIKSLLEEFARISKTGNVDIQLDEAILVMLREQVLEGVDIQDILAIFRPPSRVCEVDVVVDRPYFVNGTKTVGIPLKEQEGIAMNNLKHVPVALNTPTIVYGQEPVELRQQVLAKERETREVVCRELVSTDRIVERIVQNETIVEVPTQIPVPVEQICEKIVEVEKEVMVEREVAVETEVPYEVVKKELMEVEKSKEVPKYLYQDVAKVIEVPTYIPVVHEKPIYEIVEKKVPYILKQPDVRYLDKKHIVFETKEVPRVIEEVREKRVTVTEHCDCQKPEPVEVKIEKEMIKEIEKEIIVEKCHYIKGDDVEHIVSVECIMQKPLIQEVFREVERIVEKIVPLHVYEEKLVVIEKEIPKLVPRFEPVPITIEKPFILTNEEVKEIRVEVPVPIFIEKEVVRVVNLTEEKIVEKIVECPRVVEVEKIVEKIVPVPRIIEKIVSVPQIIEKCVVIERPVLEFITVPVDRLVIEKREVPVEVPIREEVLKVEKEIELCEVINTQELVVEKETLVEVERMEEKVVEKVIEIPRDMIKEKIVERVVQTREVVPIETIVQVPIYVPVPTPVEIEKPIFYKQPEVYVEDCRLEVEKVVVLYETKKEVEEVTQEVAVIKQVPKEVPGETVIITESELEIVEFQNQQRVVEAMQVDRPVDKYLDMEKLVRVNEQEYVQPGKVVEYLNKPLAINVQGLVVANGSREVPVEMTRTQAVDTRAIDEVVKTEIVREDRVVGVERVVEQINEIQVTKEVPIIDKDAKEVIEVPREILRTDVKCESVDIVREKMIEGLKDIIYQAETVPHYIERIVEKIVMLPQIVEVEKKVYMIEEINGLIAKDIDLQVHTAEYKETVDKLKVQLDSTLEELRKRKDRTLEKVTTLLQEFRGIVYSVDKMPKIVEKVREVMVEVEKDRPVLVPVFNSEQEIALELIIHDLVASISRCRKEEIEKNFDKGLLDLFNIEFQSGDSGFRETQAREKTEYKRSWIKDYNQEMPETSPLVHLSEKFRNYYRTYSSRGGSFGDLVASFQQHYLRENASNLEDRKVIEEQRSVIERLQRQIVEKTQEASSALYLKDKLYGDLNGMMRRLQESLPEEQYRSVVYETVNVVSEEYMTESVVKKYASTMVDAEEHRGQGASIANTEALMDKERKISEIYQQLSMYESSNFEEKRRVNQLERENEMLKEDLRIIKSSMPESESRDITERVSREWESRVKSIEESYVSEIHKLREQVTNKRDEVSSTTNEVINENRRLEEEIRRLRREYDTIRQAHDRCAINLENEKKKIIDEYERRLKGSVAPSTVERDLRREVDTLKRTVETSEKKFESQKQRIIDDYERKLSSAAGSQEREVRRQLETLKKNQQFKEQTWETEKQRIVEQHERKIRNLQQSHQNELDRVKSEIERLKTSTTRRETTSSHVKGDQDEVQRLLLRCEQLEKELEASKKDVETYQKSRLGGTAYTSGVKREGEDFQSPGSEYYGRMGGHSYGYRSPHTQSQLSKEEDVQESQLSGREEKGSSISRRSVVRSGVKVERKYEEMEEVRSSSSRISGGSESSIFKSSMSMREFMDIKKIEDKDNIASLVMIKVIEKIQEEAEKGMLNSYSPSNIFLSNFNPNNIDGLIVRFGAPITNKKSKTDGLYLAPEVHRGEGTSLKSVVFTLAVIWDELIHYEIFFKTNAEVENLSHEFKVRDTRLNPILKNTLFEMMSKDPAKRLELAEAKRRLSLQRYILSEGRAVASSSRVSSQAKKEQ